MPYVLFFGGVFLFRGWVSDKIYLICAILAHNLGRELQMDATEPQRGTTEKRSPLWIFEELDTLRRKVLQRAGRLTRANGVVTLTMSANRADHSFGPLRLSRY